MNYFPHLRVISGDEFQTTKLYLGREQTEFMNKKEF